MIRSIFRMTTSLQAPRHLLQISAAFVRRLRQKRRDARLLSGFNDSQLRDLGLRRDKVRDRYSPF